MLRFIHFFFRKFCGFWHTHTVSCIYHPRLLSLPYKNSKFYLLCTSLPTPESVTLTHWPVYHVCGLAFSDWRLSPNSMHLRSPAAGHGSAAPASLLLTRVAYDGHTRVCLSIRLWRGLLVASSFCQLWVKLLWTFAPGLGCGPEFSHLLPKYLGEVTPG